MLNLLFLEHFPNTLVYRKNKIMKSNKIILATLCGLFLSTFVGHAQEEVFITKRNNHDDNILIINNKTNHRDTTLVLLFVDNAPERFDAPKTPSFAFMSKNNKFMMGIGGYVKASMSMDFDGVINDPAYFTISNIPINPMPGNDKLLQFNANESTIFYNLVSLSNRKNNFGAYINMNFSGLNYTPVIEDAYITYGDFLIGKTTSLFTDAAAIPPTIDGEGPNGLTYKTNLVLNFRGHIGKHFATGIGLEMPTTDFTTSEYQSVTNQFIPDIPSYIQYSWGRNNSSHVRLSSIIRNVNYRNNVENKDDIMTTYACQLSGLMNFKEKVVFYYQLAYGTGLTPYIQDLSGLKLDFMPQHFDNHNDNNGKLEHVNSMAYYAGLQYNFNPRTFMSCTFSQVDIQVPDYYQDTDIYKQAYYLATNFFWYATPNVQLGAEYLYGKRVDQNDEWGQANRIQLMLQYNF